MDSLFQPVPKMELYRVNYMLTKHMFWQFIIVLKDTEINV